MNTSARYVIAVFAHNESHKITSCLEALRLSPLLPNTICYVIANGCVDDTVKRTAEYAHMVASWVKVIALEAGDKANAWNYFIHEIAIEADVYFFIDGDCQIDSGSLQYLKEHLLANPHINAVSGVPSSSNLSSGAFRSGIISKGGLAGNLYALSQSFVTRLRKQSIRLPYGLIGDDSLIGALALWDLDPNKEWDHNLVRVVPSATFKYESILRASLYDPLFYIRRLKRYSLRHFQNQLIRSCIKQQGLNALPRHINDLYQMVKDEKLVPRRSLNYYYFDHWAIRQIHKVRRYHSSDEQ